MRIENRLQKVTAAAIERPLKRLQTFDEGIIWPRPEA
jgi:hypothetical protein